MIVAANFVGLVSQQRVLHPSVLDESRAILAPTGVISLGGCGLPSTSLGSVRDEGMLISSFLRSVSTSGCSMQDDVGEVALSFGDVVR